MSQRNGNTNYEINSKVIKIEMLLFYVKLFVSLTREIEKLWKYGENISNRNLPEK